jgi:hypothetical protein
MNYFREIIFFVQVYVDYNQLASEWEFTAQSTIYYRAHTIQVLN